MPGRPAVPARPIIRRRDTVCAECGHRFATDAPDADEEDLCRQCYESQFEPRHLHFWQREGRSHFPR